MNHYLEPLDSAFVLLEVPGSAMNIGAVIELEFGEVADPKIRYELIRRNIAERLHEIPVLTQRIVRAPFDLNWPILIKDRRFDLDKHVLRVAIPAPGTADQFDALISDFLSRPLVRSRPLWQLLIIEGLADGHAAIALKVHHALADGVSGAETFAGLFDISPDVRPPAIVEADESTEAVTSSLGLLIDSLRQVRKQPSLALTSVRSWAGRLYEIARALWRVAVRRERKQSTPGQPSMFEAKRTSLNGAPGIEKQYHRLRLPLADVKRAAKARGVTVTDFVMATASGALGRLLADRGETLKKDLIAVVPINIRGDGASSELGNRLSGMLVALHTDIADAEARLKAIAKDSAMTVGFQREDGARVLHSIPRVLGPTLLSIGGRIISAFGLFDRLPPIANVLVSSVPGPPIPLWLSGHRVASAAPVGPLFASLSLNITVLGIGDSLEFGLLGCAERMPDLATLRDYVREEAESLISSTPL